MKGKIFKYKFEILIKDYYKPYAQIQANITRHTF